MFRFAGVAGIMAAIWASPAHAQCSIEGPDRTEPGRLVRLVATGPDTVKAACMWDVQPASRAELVEVGGVAVFSAPPGEYRVRLRVLRIVGDVPTTTNAEKVVRVSGAEPLVAPVVPVPLPPPPPVVVQELRPLPPPVRPGLFGRARERRELRAVEAEEGRDFRGLGIGWERGRGIHLFAGRP